MDDYISLNLNPGTTEEQITSALRPLSSRSSDVWTSDGGFFGFGAVGKKMELLIDGVIVIVKLTPAAAGGSSTLYIPREALKNQSNLAGFCSQITPVLQNPEQLSEICPASPPIRGGYRHMRHLRKWRKTKKNHKKQRKSRKH